MARTSIARRFRTPQLAALLLLLAFAVQAVYLASRTPLSERELQFISAQERGFSASLGAETGDHPFVPLSSPLTSLAARSLVAIGARAWTVRAPFVIFGLLLGACVWYIASRLYGAAGGYVALTLFAFSPTMITYAARVAPEIVAAWGVFGCIFTGIAVAHTLYAPREVVLWNWRRTLLLGLAIAIATGAEFTAVLTVVIVLALMLYLVPERRSAAVVIMAAACVVGLVILAAVYRFRFADLFAAASALSGWTGSVLASPAIWLMVGRFLLNNGPGFILLLAVSLVSYFLWRRTRFFGNSAPLIVAVALVAAGLGLPHSAGFSFLVLALPFLFVFVAGVTADLLQSSQQVLVQGALIAILLAHAYFSMAGLARLS